MTRALTVGLAVVILGAAMLVGCDRSKPDYQIQTFASTGALSTLINAAVTTTTGSELPMVGHESAVFQVTSSATATVVFYGTIDGSTWTALALADLNSTTRARATSVTASKLLLYEDGGGLVSIRPSVTSWTSGTVTVKGRSF